MNCCEKRKTSTTTTKTGAKRNGIIIKYGVKSGNTTTITMRKGRRRRKKKKGKGADSDIIMEFVLLVNNWQCGDIHICGEKGRQRKKETQICLQGKRKGIASCYKKKDSKEKNE